MFIYYIQYIIYYIQYIHFWIYILNVVNKHFWSFYVEKVIL